MSTTRTDRLFIRVSQTEKARIEALALAAGKKVSDYVREIALQQDVVAVPAAQPRAAVSAEQWDAELAAEKRRVGNVGGPAVRERLARNAVAKRLGPRP